jgi:hypothetical protein
MIQEFRMESPEVKGESSPAKPAPAPADATPATSSAPASTSAPLLQLAVVVVALVGAAALTFALLSARATAADTPTPGAASVVSSSPVKSSAGRLPAASTLARPGWSQAHAYRWVSNHPRSAAFEVESLEEVPVWTTKVRPMLVVRCLAKKTDVFVYTETAAKIESEDENHTVRLAFDNQPEYVERWPDSEEHDALFAPDSGVLAGRLASANQLRFTFTPHNAQPVTVNFDLRGADSVVSSVRKICGAR